MSSLKSKAFGFCILIFEKSIRVLGDAAYWKIMPLLVEKVDLWYPVQTRKGTLRMHCGGEVARLRAETFLLREPDTLEWIDGFAADDVLMDVGANVVVYTIYASFVRNLRVVAIEPSPFNFVELARNLMANGVSDKVIAICGAAADRSFVSEINYDGVGLKSGGSGANFDSVIENDGVAMDVAGRLKQPGFAIDDIVGWNGVAFPNHIKIDVVGTQGRILAGARRTLSDSRMKSLMVEMPEDLPEQSKLAHDTLAAAGFKATRTKGLNTFFVRKT